MRITARIRKQLSSFTTESSITLNTYDVDDNFGDADWRNGNAFARSIACCRSTQPAARAIRNNFECTIYHKHRVLHRNVFAHPQSPSALACSPHSKNCKHSLNRVRWVGIDCRLYCSLSPQFHFVPSSVIVFRSATMDFASKYVLVENEPATEQFDEGTPYGAHSL